MVAAQFYRHNYLRRLLDALYQVVSRQQAAHNSYLGLICVGGITEVGSCSDCDSGSDGPPPAPSARCAWVAEATDLVDLSKWPAGTLVILRKERPHPGAQLRFTDADGHRVTGFLTDTPGGVIAGQLAGLELRHHQHAGVEDRIRRTTATGLANLPFNALDANAVWLEIIMAATDLIAWAKLIGFTGALELARSEIETFATGVLHIAARTTRGARQLRLRIDATWCWAQPIATAWRRIRAAFT